MKHKKALATLAGFAMAAAATLAVAAPASAHSAEVSGNAVCSTDGTYTVTWTYRTSNVPRHAYDESKVIAHSPEPSELNGHDSQLQLSLWPQHSHNGQAPRVKGDHTFTFTQSGIAGSASSAKVSIQTDWSDGVSHEAYGTVTLDGQCGIPAKPSKAPTYTSWTDQGTPQCGDTTIGQTRVKTTYSYTLDGRKWVEHTATTTEHRTRDLTAAELSQLQDSCSVPWTPVKPLDASAAAIDVSTPTCAAPAVATFGDVENAHPASASTKLDQAPGKHWVTFIADDGHLFPKGPGVNADQTSMTESYTVPAQPAGAACQVERVAPTLNTATQCGALDTLTIPADTADVSYTVKGDTSQAGQVQVVAHVANGKTFPNGKDIGTWEFTLVKDTADCPPLTPIVPLDASAAVTVSAPTCDSPAVPTFSQENATWADAVKGDDGTYSRTATADDGHLFNAGPGVNAAQTTLTVTYALDAQKTCIPWTSLTPATPVTPTEPTQPTEPTSPTTPSTPTTSTHASAPHSSAPAAVKAKAAPVEKAAPAPAPKADAGKTLAHTGQALPWGWAFGSLAVALLGLGAVIGSAAIRKHRME